MSPGVGDAEVVVMDGEGAVDGLAVPLGDDVEVGRVAKRERCITGDTNPIFLLNLISVYYSVCSFQ